jgi:predicted unusual protein kinase regulating ubiquinone biosynthesis (AarF/ABC1/UbiB family)
VTAIEAAAQQVERVVLTGVGAALTARDNVVETVKPYTKRTTAQREVQKIQRKANVNVRRYERRGSTARNQLERQVKRTRTQLERELRQRRNQVTRLAKRNQRTLDTSVRGATREFRQGNFVRGAERLQTGVTGVAENVASTLS